MAREVVDSKYSSKLTIIEDEHLTEEEGADFGGVLMYSNNRKIVVANTLLDRINLVFEQ